MVSLIDYLKPFLYSDRSPLLLVLIRDDLSLKYFGSWLFSWTCSTIINNWFDSPTPPVLLFCILMIVGLILFLAYSAASVYPFVWWGAVGASRLPTTNNSGWFFYCFLIRLVDEIARLFWTVWDLVSLPTFKYSSFSSFPICICFKGLLYKNLLC